LLAGVTGAFIVLPQGVAFALIAGLPPEYGLYAAFVNPIAASTLSISPGPNCSPSNHACCAGAAAACICAR
jgi:MFS superfamily sulfate permease-like transporter